MEGRCERFEQRVRCVLDAFPDLTQGGCIRGISRFLFVTFFTQLASAASQYAAQPCWMVPCNDEAPDLIAFDRALWGRHHWKEKERMVVHL